LVKRIEREIVHGGAMTTTFDDVAGLQAVKLSIMEMIILPMQRPELFTGLRAQPKGMLLFGPPGTGKTLVGRAIASSSGAKFFSISASSLMSKWTGESEQLVATMFAMARHNEPSVVFIDEVDSLLSQRSSGEEEASRRVKTQFLNELDGVRSGDASNRERVLVVGATNRPQELDEAARRRFVKRFYVPLPDDVARRSLLGTLLKHNRHSLSPAELDGDVVDRTRGFSGADIRNLCQEAAMGPMRDVGSSLFAGGGAPGVLSEDQIPPISFAHFDNALKITRATVAPEDLVGYEAWDAQFGSARAS
ncbi:AAA-domain containing ATPase, partial [Aureococcus anophagefferens]